MLKSREVSRGKQQVLSSVLRRIRKKLAALYNWGMEVRILFEPGKLLGVANDERLTALSEH
jgi:hypothetical protein